MRAKKHLGQHFLEDQAVIQQILNSIQTHCDNKLPVIEVGPGQGILTFDLTDIFKKFTAIEFDRDMVSILDKTLKPGKVINADFLSFDLIDLYKGEPLQIVGNFPYNISSQIIFKILDNMDRVPVMVGMFQKEVAERICATPGGKKNGILSVLTQAHYTAEKLFDIGPEAFNPPPRVDSSVIVLKRKESYKLPCDPKLYKRIIKTAFSQRRKKMRNTLKSVTDDLSHPLMQKRPEELSVEEFVIIATLIEKSKTL